MSAVLRTWGGSGDLEIQRGLFPLMGDPILSQVMEQYFQAKGASRSCCSCREDSSGRVFKMSGCCKCPGTAADTGAVRRVLGLSSKGDVRF